MEQCETCRFFQAHHWGVHGECRRHAPSVGYVKLELPNSHRDEREPAGVWPMVQNAYWCGDWTAKETNGANV